MPGTSRCDLHELENCALCNGDVAKLESSIREPLTSVFAARYAGNCACGKRFSKGDLIGKPALRPSDDWLAVECCGLA